MTLSLVRFPTRKFSPSDRYSAWPLKRGGRWVLEVFHDGETCCEVPLDDVVALDAVGELFSRIATAEERRLDPSPLVLAARPSIAEGQD